MTINDYESIIWKFLLENQDYCLVNRSEVEIISTSMLNEDEKYVQATSDPSVIECMWVVMDGSDRIVEDNISSIKQAIKLLAD